jgi:NusA-like KH domain protein
MRILDMQYIRYLNLLERVSNVRTKHCFTYNNTILFVVPRAIMARAIGPDAVNIKRIYEVTGKKARIIGMPNSINEAGQFISEIIAPFHVNEIHIENKEIILKVGSHNKSALIGRNKTRLGELQGIAKDYFDVSLRIV